MTVSASSPYSSNPLAVGALAKTLLIAGTDTEVGKTVVTAALAAYWQTYRKSERLGLMKLIQSGVGDREYYQQHFSLDQSPELYNPLHFEAPLAPPLAADLAGITIDLGLVWRSLSELIRGRDRVLIEGLGGLGSHVTHELTRADLAGPWRLPTLLVVPVKLGAIAQTVANVALARQTQVLLQGIVLTCHSQDAAANQERWAPQAMIESLTQIPVCGVVPPVANLTDMASLCRAVQDIDFSLIS